MAHYVLVAPLEPLQVGDGFSISAWPLHVTVVSNFVTDLAVERIAQLLATTARPMDVVAGHEDLFGPRNNVRVCVVEHSEELAALHESLVAALTAAGVTFDTPEYLGAGYRPHLTATKRARATEGDILHLAQLALVDMQPQGDSGHRRVVWTTSLRD